MQKCININLKKDKVILKIDENASHEDVMGYLKKKLSEIKKLYKEDKTPMLITGKVLKNKEIEEIQDLIKKELDIKIEFDSPKILGLHGIRKTFKKEIATSETKFHRTSLRSGQKVEFEGSLVILGDVNGGAEVIAGENIVVLGTLRGLAHAGAKGNKDAIISAGAIETPQLRIANVIKEVEREELEDDTLKTIAFINENDEIIIE